jgi:predicted secreted hydrolase
MSWQDSMTIVTVLAVATWLAYSAMHSETAHPARNDSLMVVLGGNDSGYARANRVREFHFPRDYGAHPGFRHEWWYFTGNLTSVSGRKFGYELTIFRFALRPAPPQNQSAWATNQLYMAHLALTDPQAQHFTSHERFSRGALGLAGARSAPFRVWLEDWSISTKRQGYFPWRLRAATGAMALDLELLPVKPLVLQGDRGLDRKSARGDASYYYSYTRLATSGRLRLDKQIFKVSGLSWLDREWSSGGLAPDQAGWDWFALQFDDGSDMMFYRLRKKNGRTDPYSSGVWVAPDGGTIPLAHDAVVIKTLDYWDSPYGGRYPARWRLDIPARDCQITVAPVLADQELNLSVRYWEGAVHAWGACAGQPIHGRGYVELTGYARKL